MNRLLFCDYWQELKRLQKIKKLNQKLTKDQNQKVLDLLDEAAFSFPIDDFLLRNRNASKEELKAATISPFKTLRRDVLIDQLWRLLQAE